MPAHPILLDFIALIIFDKKYKVRKTSLLTFPRSTVPSSSLIQASIAGLSNAAPVIYFPGALIYSAGFNINQNFREKF
jgi:hypothetical protein